VKNVIKTLLLLATLTYLATSVAPAAAFTPRHIFVFVGQSNGQGMADIPQTQWTSGTVAMWKTSGWAKGKEPTGIYSGSRFSSSMSFAREIQQSFGSSYRVGIVNCALAGTKISQWQRGNVLYENCVNWVKNAKGNDVISAIIMLQGEADTRRMEDVNAWTVRASTFARNLRVDIGASSAPLIFARLGYNPEDTNHPFWGNLYSKQALLVGNMRYMITTEDLEKYDGIHYATPSQIEIGKRAARMYIQKIGK
jgi:hypothetical protein